MAKRPKITAAEIIDAVKVAAEVVEPAAEVVEPVAEPAAEVVETVAAENNIVSISIKTVLGIKSALMTFDSEQLKEIIEFCDERIEELQQDEVDELEEQMRALQEKLAALKGYKKPVEPAVETENKRKYTGKVVINPETGEIYRAGRAPEWLNKLCQETGKTVSELRVDDPTA